MRRDERGVARGLLEAQRQFASWRETRQRGARIPDDLWALAVEMAGQHGVSRTVTALHLDYYSLQKRLPQPSTLAHAARKAPAALRAGNGLEGAKPWGRKHGTQPALLANGSSRPEFVELRALGTFSARCHIELRSADGASLRIEIEDVALPNLEALTQQFWSGE